MKTAPARTPWFAISRRRWIQWAERAVEFGSTELLGASGIDSTAAVTDLRARFDAWNTVIDDAARFCRIGDETSIRWMDVPAETAETGFNDEHRYVRQVTAERLRRLRELADRLRTGQSRLRLAWVPNV